MATVTAIITQDELNFLQALRSMLSSSEASASAPPAKQDTPAPSAPSAPSAPAKQDVPAAPAKQDTPKPPAKHDTPSTPAADTDRPFMRPAKQRTTKLEKQLEDAISSGAKESVIAAARKAVVVGERKKLVADLKRLQKLIVAQPDDAAAIKDEIRYVNAEIDDLDTQLKVEPESTITDTPAADTPVAPKPPATPKPPAAPKPPVPKVKKMKTVEEKVMTDLADGGTYQAFIEAGWTDTMMIDGGYMVIESKEVECEDEAGDVIDIDTFRTKVGAAFPKAAATNRIEAVNDIIAKFGATIDTIPEADRAEVLSLINSILGE